MDRLHGSQEASHIPSCCGGETKNYIFLKSALCSQKEKKKHIQIGICPKDSSSQKPAKILLQCLWERGSQLAEKRLFRAPCHYAPVSLESSYCRGQCDFTAVGR